MISINQHKVELALKEIAEQTEKRIINEGIPALVTYHAYVINDRLRESRISVNRTDIQNHIPVNFDNKREIIQIMKGTSTVDKVSVEHALNFVLWHS